MESIMSSGDGPVLGEERHLRYFWGEVERKKEEKMKKILSLLLALALVLAFSLVAVPVVANGVTPDRVTAITNAADRLVALQGTDGGWDWIVTGLNEHSGTYPSPDNLFGVTALGLTDAYLVTGDSSYLDAAEDAADGILAKWPYDPTGFLGYSQDYRFLMAHASASGDSSYSTSATTAWATQKTGISRYADGNQSDLYDYQFVWTDPDSHGYAAWQCADFGLAAVSMGDSAWASNMAGVLSGHLSDIPGSDIYRFIGWGWALAFLQAVDSVTYSSEISALITNLSNSQNGDGSWGSIGGNPEGQHQDTAYVVMGLAAAGQMALARDGAQWLVANQLTNGGWAASDECSEADSEALQALAATEAPVTVGTNGYYTIQAAIDAASSGDTIQVAAGVYTEDLFIHPSKQNLELAGAGAGTTIIRGTTVGVAGVPNINVHADGVKIHGFTIETADCNGGGWVDGLILNGFDIEIYDNYFKVVSTVGTDGGAAIQTWRSENVALQNTQYGFSPPRVSDVSGLNIHDNEFTGVGVDYYMAIWINYDDGSGLATISGNTMGGPLYVGVGTERSNTLIEDNVISTSYTGAGSRGINVYDYNDRAQQDVAVEGNTVSDFESGIRIGGGSQTLSNISVTQNTVHNNNTTGILVRTSAGGVVVNYNDISGNTAGVSNTGGGTLDATYNWWGDGSGPSGLGPGSGDAVSANVDYDPWIGSVSTTTGTGTAYFTPSEGTIGGITAVATPPGPPVVLPHGMFSFNITGLTPGQNVTVTIVLPGPVPVGSVWWKYQGGSWYWLPIGDDDGDDTITVTLTDGGQGDADLTVNGQIIDPGGPGLLARGLIIRSTEGGRVTKPGEGHHVYDHGTVVKLVATPDDGYKFVEWTHDVRRIDDVNAAETTITMDWSYVIIANFVTVETATTETSVQYDLNVSSTIGGSVASPGEGTFPYIEGTLVSLVANPDAGYKFVNWTGDGITSMDSTTTSITMNGDHAVTANFEFEQTTDTDSGGESSVPVGACFIATAAYGTPTAEQIDVLREFRDVVLLGSSVGSEFVALYYQLSPPVADFIAGNSLLRAVVRELVVDPVIWVVEATGAIWRN
jgi:hypothetical protein